MSACKSCGAAIIWTITAAGRPSPVDAQPSDGAPLEITPRNHARVTGEPEAEYYSRYVPPEERDGRTDLHRSHFETCPDREKWRKPKGVDTESTLPEQPPRAAEGETA